MTTIDQNNPKWEDIADAFELLFKETIFRNMDAIIDNMGCDYKEFASGAVIALQKVSVEIFANLHREDRDHDATFINLSSMAMKEDLANLRKGRSDKES